MKTIHNSVGAMKVAVTRNTVFAFKARPELAPKGLINGTFVMAAHESGGEPGKEFSRLVVTVELETKDGNNQPFRVTKAYNLLGRGVSAFVQDFQAWSGLELTDDDLYSEFDAQKLITGKPVIVNVEHRKVGKDWEAYIAAFHPAGYKPDVTVGETAATTTEKAA